MAATNVRDDPKYWEAHLTHINPQIRAMAHTQLARIQHERDMDMRRQQFAESQEEIRAGRRERLAQGAQEHTERMKEAEAKRQELAAYREAQLGQNREVSDARRAVGYLNLAQSPELDTLYGKQAPAMRKALLNAYYQSLQGEGGGVTPATPVGGLPGLGGGTPADPAAVAVRNQLQAAGKKVVPETVPSPTSAPVGVPQRGNVAGVPPQQTPAPQTPNVPPAVRGGLVYGGPTGYDFNVNTGEWMPSSLVGTINGRPGTEVVAEGAMRRGVSPEDTRSREVYNVMRAREESRPEFGEGSVGAPAYPRAQAVNFGDQLLADARRLEGGPTVAGGQGVETPTAPTGPGQLSRWSFQPLIGPAAGGAVDRFLNVGGARPEARPEVVETAPSRPQRPLVPADYIAHWLGLNPVKPPPPPPPIVRRREEEE